ncbi:MAG: right-handed parallel beta-helix repeat-containing protein, partial [Armatimonadia bacterium]
MRLRKEWLLGSVVALVLLSSVAFAATAVYVDDSWAGSSVGATVGNGYTFGTNAFATVQAGIDAVEAGGTVNVAAGNYPEDLRVAKSVTLRGPNAGINPVTNGAARGLEAQLESVNVPNDADINGLTIDGLKFSGSSPNGTIWLSYYGSNVTITNNIIDGITYHGIVHNPEYPSGVSHNYMTGVQITNNKITNISGGTYTALYFFGLTDGVISGNAISNVGGIGINLVNANEGDSSKLVTVTVSGNTVTNCGLQGIQMAFGAGNVTISGNTVSGANYTSASDKGGIRLYGSQFWGPVTVSGNTVTNSYNGLCIRDGENLSATAQYIAIKDNTFTSNANAAIYHGGTGTLDAKTGNNFNGAATLAGIEAQVYHYYDNSALGLVDYGQPTTLAAVYVDDDWATCTRGQIVGGHIFGHDAFATVQAGIDAVDAGGTVNVAAGTYNENVSYAKSVNVLGPNAGISPVDPTKTRVDEAVLNSITQTANAS